MIKYQFSVYESSVTWCRLSPKLTCFILLHNASKCHWQSPAQLKLPVMNPLTTLFINTHCHHATNHRSLVNACAWYYLSHAMHWLKFSLIHHYPSAHNHNLSSNVRPKINQHTPNSQKRTLSTLKPRAFVFSLLHYDPFQRYSLLALYGNTGASVLERAKKAQLARIKKSSAGSRAR